MTKVLVLGAGGRIARWAIDMLAKRRDVALTLVLRDASKLHGPAATNAHVIEGDVLDSTLLDPAMAGQDVVYANLAGDVDVRAGNIVRSMKTSGVERLILITALGIHDEVPGKFGKWNQKEIGEYLGRYRKAADLIEASGLSYTIVRPAWLTDADEVDDETTERNEPFRGTEVSRKSVAALVVELIGSPTSSARRNLGVNKPNTDGDKPAFV
jgi:uncharacterized protein YbjT (DUF2867 family)